MNGEQQRAASLARESLARLDSISAAAADRLIRHFALLYAWNRRTNLTAIRDPAEGVSRHLLESLEAVPLLAGRSGVLADLGSGNGYPGLALLAVLDSWRGYLFETSERKAAFLAAVVRETGLADRVAVRHQRVTRADELPPEADTVTFRAFPEPECWFARLIAREETRQVLAWLSPRDADAVTAQEGLRGLPVSRHELRAGHGVIVAFRRPPRP